VLCIPHADEIDQAGWGSRFPTDLLVGWKRDQLATYDAAIGGSQLSEDEAAEVLQASIESTIVMQATTITVGGTGGSAPLATGGGGGALGPGAVGGAGGSIGRIRLDGTPGASGAGGGGAGFMAPGAIRRDRATSEPHEGKGFSSGMDGNRGNDTTVSLGDEVLLRAAGGEPGLAGSGIRATSAKLTVSTLMLANYVETGSVVYVARGGWQNYRVLNLPTQEIFPVLVIIEAGGVPPGEYTMTLEAVAPDRTARSRVSFPVTVEEAGDVLRIPRTCTLEPVIDAFGLWTVTASTPLGEVGRIDLLVGRLGET